MIGTPRRDTVTKRLVFAALGTAWLAMAWRAPWGSVGGFTDLAEIVAVSWGWLGWIAVAAATLVPSPASLTVARVVAPLAVACAVADADSWAAAAATVAAVAMSSGTFCDAMVQGGAYGDERRFCLRVPVPQLAPAALAWTLLVVSALGGSLTAAEQRWPVAIPLLLLAGLFVWRVPVRLHQLSRRWLVIVPAGVVVHDPIVLAETVMVKRHALAGVVVARRSTDAFDLTGGTADPRLDVTLRTPEKVIVSDVTARILGINGAAHVTTFAIAPKRTGAAFAALSR